MLDTNFVSKMKIVGIVITYNKFQMLRNSIMGSRWSTTPEESQNLAAESFLALLGIQSKYMYF